jgi:ribose transport system ATP-binding protein
MPLLEMRGISKHFVGVQALQNVDFVCEAGEVHALVGENGAGKSTLMQILSGVYQADAGEIRLRGQPIELRHPLAAQQMGISAVYQEFNLIPYLDVAQNLLLHREPRGRFGLLDSRALYARARQILAHLDLDIDLRAPVARLSVAQQQLLEIARALSFEASLLIMDEPTASLTRHEQDRLFEIIRRLKARGVGVIYVSHRLDEIFAIADRITVLKDGRQVGTVSTAQTDRQTLVRMMVGRPQKEDLYPPPAPGRTLGPVVLRVEHLTRPPMLEDVSFEVRAGEVVGLAGLVGAGRTEVARAIFGADAGASGAMYVDGRPRSIRSPRDAVHAGIGFVTENRKEEGLALGLAARANLLAVKPPAPGGLLVSGALERSVAQRLADRVRLAASALSTITRFLSGGNQQKVVLGKWLHASARVLILDEPTRGIDVGAKMEVCELIRGLAERGTGVLLISSELPEVLGMSDRVLVMRHGRMVAEFGRAEATEERVMQAAAGVDESVEVSAA